MERGGIGFPRRSGTLSPAVRRSVETPRAVGFAVGALGGNTLGMVVIARFPRLDGPVVAVGPGDGQVVVATTAVAEDFAPPGPVGNRERVRRRRVPFPVVSTTLLALIAGGLWAAVWRDEQRRASDERQRAPEAIAMEPDTETGSIR